MKAPVPLADIHRGMTFSLRKPFDPTDVHAKVCGVSRVGRWNGYDWVWFTRGPSATDPGTALLEKTQVEHVYPVTDEQYRQWSEAIVRWRCNVHAVTKPVPAEPMELTTARREVAAGMARLDLAERFWSRVVERQEPIVPDPTNGQYALFPDTSDAA